MTLRSLSALVLALMLALTGQSMAVARGASAAMGQMVLCTGAGPVAIYVDAQGKPTSAPHICPDSALNVAMTDAVALVAAPMRIVVCISRQLMCRAAKCATTLEHRLSLPDVRLSQTF